MKKQATEIIYGHRACLAILEHRREDVLRIGCTREREADVEKVQRMPSEEPRGARRTRESGAKDSAPRTARAPSPIVLSEKEIERIARSPQHEGLVIETTPRKWTSPQELSDRLVKKRGTAIALDRVRNSYNIGAILRSAAFFGIDGVLLGTPAPHPGLDANAIRVAEGGAELLTMSRTTDLADSLARLRARGVHVIGTDGHADKSALTHAFERPCVVVLGNEREGLGPRVRAQCDALVAIRGSGAVESLNVGVAAGVLCAQLSR